MGTIGHRPQRKKFGTPCLDNTETAGSKFCLESCSCRRGCFDDAVLCADNGFRWSEDVVLKKLNEGMLSNPVYVLNNLFVFPWESDFLAKSPAGYWTEVEVKVSKADFRRDFIAKKDKHDILSCSMGNPHAVVPNRFYYAVPDILAMDILGSIPEYAGLVQVDKWTNGVSVLKEAPLLTKTKWSDQQLDLTSKFYFNFKQYKAKYDNFSAEKAELKSDIAFIKAEFKAETGKSWKEHLNDVL